MPKKQHLKKMKFNMGSVLEYQMKIASGDLNEEQAQTLLEKAIEDSENTQDTVIDYANKEYLEALATKSQEFELPEGKPVHEAKIVRIKKPLTKKTHQPKVPPANPPAKTIEVPAQKDKTSKATKETVKKEKKLDTLAGDTKGDSSIPSAPGTSFAIVALVGVALSLGIYLYVRNQ
jgi:outer membrane biosynthesis protein TonB